LIFRITTICAVRVCFDELSNGETVGRFAGRARGASSWSDLLSFSCRSRAVQNGSLD